MTCSLLWLIHCAPCAHVHAFEVTRRQPALRQSTASAYIQLVSIILDSCLETLSICTANTSADELASCADARTAGVVGGGRVADAAGGLGEPVAAPLDLTAGSTSCCVGARRRRRPLVDDLGPEETRSLAEMPCAAAASASASSRRSCRRFFFFPLAPLVASLLLLLPLLPLLLLRPDAELALELARELALVELLLSDGGRRAV